MIHGLYITEERLQSITFTRERNNHAVSTPKVTSKEVQQAIKEGKATVELLQAEINRLKEKEEKWHSTINQCVFQ